MRHEIARSVNGLPERMMALTSRLTLAAASGGAGLAALTSLAPAQDRLAGVSFAPHRAVYEITLARSSAGSGVADMTGRMVYELVGSACDGWTQNMRFVTRMTNQEGEAQINDLRTSSWEAAHAAQLRFNSSQYRNDQLAEASQGDASRTGEGGRVIVDLTKPEKKKLTFAPDVMFPIQHSMELIASARAGKDHMTADLYDGSDKGDKVNTTSTAIGKKFQAGSTKSPASLKNGEKLDALASWPMAISYYDVGGDKKDSVPTYELGFRFYENGVSTKLTIDYGEFAIKGDLTELNFLEPGKCPDGPADKR